MKRVLSILLLFTLLFSFSPLVFAENDYSIKIDIHFNQNLLFSKYNVVVYLDRNRLGTIPHGKQFTKEISNVSSGTHSLQFVKDGDSSVTGETSFKITGDSAFSCRISSSSRSITVYNVQVSTISTPVPSSTTPTPSSSTPAPSSKQQSPTSYTLSDFKNSSFVLEYAQKLKKFYGSELEKGSSGSAVRAIQRLLASMEYISNSGIDGAYGDITTKAITTFQKDHGLSQTGIADLPTQFLLLVKSPESDFTDTTNGTIVISNGNYAFIYWKGGTSFIGQTESSYTLYNGTYIFSSNDYYIGTFSHDKRSGKGTAYFNNGDVYIGNWENDKMNGNGKYYFGGLKSKETYDGEWVDNKMSGRGTYTLSNGQTITGKWSNNKHKSW